MKNYLPLFLILLFSLDFYAQDISGTPARDALALQSYLTGYNVAISKINQLQNEINSSESNLLIAAASDKTAIQNKIDSLQIAVSNIKPEAIDNGKAILAILNYYSVESIQDLNSIRNMDFNYFINTHVRDIITKQTVLLTMSGNYDAGQGKVEELPVSEAGIFDATSTLDALGTFIAERFKEELTIEYLKNFRDAVSNNPEFEFFFPSTLHVILKNDPFMYNSFLTSMQASVKDDLNKIPEHLIHYTNSNFASLPSSLQTDKTRYLMSFIELCNSIFTGTKVPAAINNLGSSAMLNQADENTPMRNYLLLASLLSRTLTEKDGSWVSADKIAKICNNDKTFQIFIGLSMMNEKKNAYVNGTSDLFNEIKFNSQTLRNLLTSNAAKIKGLAMYWNRAGTALGTLTVTFEEVGNTQATGDKIEDITSLLNGFNSITKAIQEIMPSDQIANDYFKVIFPTADLTALTKTLSSVNEIYLHAAKQEYSLALSNLMLLLDDGSKDNAFLNSMSKYGIFLTTLAEADSKDEMYEAIKTAALPVGSFRIKRMAKTNVALNAYAGGFYGWDLQQDDTKTNYFGFTAPVGIAFSTSLGPKKSGTIPDQATQYFSRHSLSLFFSVIDIGAITAFKVTNDSTETLPTITWNNFIAPGAYIIWGIRKSPISIGGGVQYGPQIKMLDDLNTDSFAKWNFRLSCTVDIPLLNFNTKPRTD